MERRLELALISLGHASIHWYNAIFFLLLPVLAVQFDASFTQLGLLATIKTLASAVINAPGSALIDFFGKRRLAMAISLIWAGLCYLAISLAPSYWVVAVCFAVIALAGVLWHAPAMATLSERFADRRGTALSVHEFGANVGDFVAPLAVGAMLSAMYWRDALRLNTILGVVLGVALLFLLRESGRMTRPGGKQATWADYREGVMGLVRNTVLLRLSAISSLRSMGQIGLMTTLPLYITFGFGVSDPRVVGFHLSMLTLASLFAGPVLGTVSDYLGRKPIMIFGLLASGGAALLLPVAPRGVAFVAVLLGLGLVLFSIRPVVMANALDVTPNHLGASVIGLVFTVQAAFSATTPLLIGWIGDTFHIGASFYLVGALILASACVAMTLPSATPQARVSEPQRAPSAD
jgi:MFS family permease